MAEPIDIVLCDDHAVVRSGLHRILEAEPDLEVVGEAGTAEQAVALASKLRPRVVVMDLTLPDASGIAATREVLATSPDSRVLVLTVHDDVAYLRQAFEAGAAGYLVKDAADVDLVQAIREVASGDRYVHPRLAAELLRPDSSQALGGPGGELSEREVEVLRLIALGFTNSEIAEQLVISVRTVETHRAHIQQKLGRRSRAELAGYARDAGLLEDPHQH